MCGRFTIISDPAMVAAIFRVAADLEFPPRYNIAPTQPVPVVTEQHGRRSMQLMRWGFVPRWVKDPRDFPLLINARSETMIEKPAFREAMRHGRCIVPADGYFEWRTTSAGKQPFYITRADGAPMGLAALCNTWEGPNGEEVDTVALITVAANAALAAVHDRMPAILDPVAFDAWLDGGNGPAEAAQLALPLPDEAVRFHPVSRRVNSANQDDPNLIVATPEEAPPPPRPKKMAKAKGGGQLDLF